MTNKSQFRPKLNKEEQRINGGVVARPLLLSAPLRDEHFAAAFLGVSVATIRRWRLLGMGPRYRKIVGSVRYAVSDLDQWLSACPTGGSGKPQEVR
jgi:hypothetical protein